MGRSRIAMEWAVVRVTTAGKAPRRRCCGAGRVFVGERTGADVSEWDSQNKVDSVEIRWPSWQVEQSL